MCKCLAQGSQGGCFWLSDVISAENASAFSSGTRVPEWMLPDVEEPIRLMLRPDAVRIATLSHDAEAPRTRAERSQRVIDLMEFGYCGDTRMAGKSPSPEIFAGSWMEGRQAVDTRLKLQIVIPASACEQNI